uniref:Innexin n=1 Tax=Ditylenchus dipsaci TaxID=166011 RepID=A0A915D717_9BILA
MAPAESPKSWIPYINSYCFVTGTYVIDKAVELMPQDEVHPLDASKIDVSYYQWVPYVLVLQAAFFYGPHLFWSLYRKSQTDVSFNHLVDKCVKSRGLSTDKYDEEVEDVVANIVKTYEHRQIKEKSAGLGSAGMFAYLVSKLLNVLNVVAQLVLVSIFIGNAGFGFQVIDNAMDGQYWNQTGYFPRSAFCTFKQSALNGEQPHTIQCVLMMNMLNEKIFVLLYVWFIILLFASVINVLYVFVRYVSPFGQRSSTKRYLKSHPLRDDVEWRKFADLQLDHDGLLLLRFIENNAGFLMASEVACKLYDSLRNSSVQVEEKIVAGDGGSKKQARSGDGWNDGHPLLYHPAVQN